MHDRTNLKGFVDVTLRAPDGSIKSTERVDNVITQVGDTMYADRGANIGGPPAAPVGMKLGTGGATAAASTGAGAHLVTYKTGSNVVFDATPTSSTVSNLRRVVYKSTWAATVATDAALSEAIIHNATNTDAAGSAANTISRVTFTAINKGAADSLELTWNHDIGTAD